MSVSEVNRALPPGSVIGILGGGQLGRMLAVSATQLGYNCHIYAPEENSVAAGVAQHFTCAAYDDTAALEAFARACDVITYEFENVPVECAKIVARHVPLRPGYKALEVAQDRAEEKEFARASGGVTADFALVGSEDELRAAAAEIGLPAILKTNRFGYDGKGQVRLKSADDIAAAWHAVAGQPCVLEGFVDFAAEFSVILARALDGTIATYDSAENVHENGILALSTVPASDAVLRQIPAARDIAAKIAQRLDYVGVLTCEFFVGTGGPVLNEIAPRVHNSGHWSMEGAVASQFENHIRGVCGLPLGSTALTGTRAEMRNIIGDAANDWANYLADPDCHLHLYGKGEPREGRKMGHATWVAK
ncbi:5-(carboxyamino)imidazole ribonucleotide synthase [Sphingorhabdus sp. Alg239-R122]|uniref:5-(carboxyamino)imidazole ribonucleotide synthase n=1 Tax=Sphingorhabdus sp. Alg239-R122 TaxID=2305989 RepID=UPI0013D95A98|nr:5-(carboxyamino)imidazole ribonucleotide synthase [Sphingorhabdus sp. Alg239-R122]